MRNIIGIMGRKLNLFGNLCGMEETTPVKNIIFGIMERTCKRGRPN